MGKNVNLSTQKDKKRWRAMRRVQLHLPRYTLGEEIANAITHGIGALLAAVALIVLIVMVPKNITSVLSVSIYGGTLFLLYTVSTLYHALEVTKAKKVFQVLDHCTIFLLIAGTYTPITFLCLQGTFGQIVFTVIWSVAILGIILNAVDLKRFKVFSMICYLGMSWCIVFTLKGLMNSMDSASIFWLFFGGVFYTVGAVLYGKGKKTPYMHTIWHVFVLLGSIAHFIVVYRIAIL